MNWRQQADQLQTMMTGPSYSQDCHPLEETSVMAKVRVQAMALKGKECHLIVESL